MSNHSKKKKTCILKMIKPQTHSYLYHSTMSHQNLTINLNQSSLFLCLLNIVAENGSPEIVLTKDIIKQFDDHFILFHFENETKYLVNTIVATSHHSYYSLNNVDYSKVTKEYLERADIDKILHIVILQNYGDFEIYTKTSVFSLKYVDIVLILIFKMSEEFVFQKGNMLEKAGGLFIFDRWSLSLYTVCFFCGNLTGTLRKIDNVSVEEGNKSIYVPDLHEYMNEFKDFNKHLLHVERITAKPIFYLKEIQQLPYPIYEERGIAMNMIRSLSEKLNFKYLPIPLNYNSPRERFSKLLLAFNNNEIDFSLITEGVNAHTILLVDLTTTILIDRMIVLYNIYEDPWESWKHLLAPFQTYVWITLLGIIFVVSLLLSKLAQNISLLFFIGGWIRLLLGQSLTIFSTMTKNKWSLIISISTWLLLTSIISYFYQSKLTASIIKPKIVEYDITDELLDNGFSFILDGRYRRKETTDPKLSVVFSKSVVAENMNSSIEHIIGRKVALITSLTVLKYQLYENAVLRISNEDHDNMRLLREDLFTYSIAWPMKLNSPIKQKFDSIILWLHANGLIAKWFRDEQTLKHIIPRSHQKQIPLSDPKFTIYSIIGPAIIWTIGMCMASLVFIGERLIAYYYFLTNSNFEFKSFF